MEHMYVAVVIEHGDEQWRGRDQSFVCKGPSTGTVPLIPPLVRRWFDRHLGAP